MVDKDELKRLKKENHELKKELHKLKRHRDFKDKDNDNKSYAADSYFAFLFAKLKQKKHFPIFKKYFKGSLWLTRIFKWGVLLYQYLQAGAFVILYTAAFILVIPIILAVSLVMLITALVLRDKNTKLLFDEIKNDVVFIIFKSKGNFDKDKFFDIAAMQGEKTVFLVSPFFFSKKGIGTNEKMYVCHRKESENVFILRSYFFFYFRRRLKTEKNCNIKEIFLN